MTNYTDWYLCRDIKPKPMTFYEALEAKWRRDEQRQRWLQFNLCDEPMRRAVTQQMMMEQR